MLVNIVSIKNFVLFLIVFASIVSVKQNIENNNLNKMLLMMFLLFLLCCFVVRVCLFKFFPLFFSFIQQNMLRNILKTSDLKPQNFLSKHCFMLFHFQVFFLPSSFLLHLYKPPKNSLYF
ncbi:unnamed protein product [Meloidogyne enterolobii]|uniref:Uncharacterized protein n=1 Tax=Meloidogyne enterolobii TaxID=390850 RepID=A0ACB0YKS3_MELEN